MTKTIDSCVFSHTKNALVVVRRLQLRQQNALTLALKCEQRLELANAVAQLHIGLVAGGGARHRRQLGRARVANVARVHLESDWTMTKI